MSILVDELTVAPEPSRLLEGLRDTGYEFTTAVADIVDNSIAANATRVEITAFIGMDDGVRVSIADNGHGMDKDALAWAMRYGAPERDDIHSLGKFGLGLKTASTSCCRRLKVLSTDKKDGDISCAVWDLDYISKRGEWLLRVEKPTPDDLEEFEDCAGAGPGTLVVWEKCDRLLSARYTNHTTSAFKKAFDKQLVVLRQHLAMVFQRFLDPADDRAENVEIYINGTKVEAWDPFCCELVEDVGVKEYVVTCNDDDFVSEGTVKVRAFIVPNNSELTVEQKKRVQPGEGDKDLRSFSADNLMGFYVYRENRLIHWGDWFGMPGVDFHHRLCRFELSFDALLDEAFQIDIKKSRIILNDTLKEELFKFVHPIKKEGDARYRGQKQAAAATQAKGLHEDSNAVLSTVGPALAKSTMTPDSSGRVTVHNKHGLVITDFSAVDSSEAETPVKVEDGLNDGLLWEPGLIGKVSGVRLNSNHEFYQRFYGVNKGNPSAIQAMDSMFWALAEAETSSMEDKARQNLEDARYEASRLLRKLAKELPEVSIEDFGDDD